MDNMDKRLIEVDFPLKQTSLDSAREKYGPKGHISGFHLWPARRPLAASRAVLISTLLPDPSDEVERKMIMEKLAGRLVERVKKKKLPNGQVEEKVIPETEGGILRWGRESSVDVHWFRDKIREAYGGHAPKILDPFAGGGAIPLEAMRLGCEVTAIDINPVAWFILKCSLEYPQRFAHKLHPLPSFAYQSHEFMESYFKAKGFKGAALEVQLTSFGRPKDQASQPQLTGIQTDVVSIEADLTWHVRAWGLWVLHQAKTDLARFYPTVDGKPTVAYLWARTVICKNCRATVPLLKTRWLCKKDNKRVVLTMEQNSDKTGVVFGVQNNAPSLVKGSAVQKREHDKKIAGGTMSRSGVTCPCCSTIMTMDYLRSESVASRTDTVMTVVVVEGENGKEYRLPTEDELCLPTEAEKEIAAAFAEIPFGLPEEAVPQGTSRTSGGSPFTVFLYGLTRWCDLFTPRQLLAIGTFVKHTRTVREVMRKQGYPPHWIEAVGMYLATSIDRLIDHSTSLATWYLQGENVKHTFVRYALPIIWDFAETNTLWDARIIHYPG